MSRLRALQVPFVVGINDDIDAKVLPDGALADLRNGRVDRAGSLRLRRGWRPVSLETASDTESALGTPTGGAVDLYSTSRGLVALVEDDAKLALQTYTQHSTSIPWVRRTSQSVPPATRARSVGAVPDLPASVARASCAVTADGVWGATLEQTTTQTILRVFRLASDETLFFGTYADTNVRKVVSLGATFGIVDSTGAALRVAIFDPSLASGWLGAEITLASVAASQFDAASAVETTPTRLHLVYVVSGAVTYRQFSTAGVEQGSGKTVVASGALNAYVASDDATVHVVYQDAVSSELSLLSFSATPTFTTTAGPTALNAGVAYGLGLVAIGFTPNGASSLVHVAAEYPSIDVDLIQLSSGLHASKTITKHESCRLAVGWVTRGGYAGVGLVRGTSVGGLDVYYTDNDSPWLTLAFTLAGSPTGPFAPGQAPSGDVLTPWPRLSDATARQSRAAGQLSTRQAGVTAWRVFDTDARRPGVEFAGALYVTGGVLTQYVSGTATENGFLRPVIESLGQANSTGTIANGTYSYRVVVVWTDAGGRTHRSPVSDAVNITTTGANDTVTATVHVAKTLRRDGDAVLAPVVELYRTEAGPGELFYHVATTAMTNTNDQVSVVDTSPDANIIDNRRLYTEGEFGAVSGALDIAPPNPSAYAAVLRDRLLLASPTPAYQVSQITLPEEPVAFTQPGFSGPTALSYQDSVEGDLTAVATLDDTMVLATADALYVSGGEGPNLAGVGEFLSPARLPSDVGVYSADSLVEDASGLWFLGDPERLYLLPRGQAAPGAAMAARERFAGGTVVGAAVDVTDDTTCWAVAAAAGVLVSRHAQDPNPWAQDDLPFVPRALVTHDRALYALDSSGGVWTNSAAAFGDGASGGTAVALRATTGDVQAFGLSGWGRLAGVEVLGEFQAAAAVLVEISYDMGLSWTSLGTHTVSGLAVGQAWQRQWYPARQRGGKFRLRATMTPSVTTTEGCRLTGFTLYFDQRSGPTRLDSAKRR